MIVDTRVYFWTPSGMSERLMGLSPNATAYIETAEVVRLLEDAHRKGVQDGIEQARVAFKTGRSLPP